MSYVGFLGQPGNVLILNKQFLKILTLFFGNSSIIRIFGYNKNLKYETNRTKSLRLLKE